MSTGCEFYADALVDLAGGRLEEERVERVEAHLAECAECRATLAVIEAVRGAPAPVPDGLEHRIREAVLGSEVAEPMPATPMRPRPLPLRPRGHGWRAWALPAAAAAALALWFGANELLVTGPEEPSYTDVAAVNYEPYGAWPGSNGELAGEPVLSDLTVEELEALLEEMR